jgi:hypothetical protein
VHVSPTSRQNSTCMLRDRVFNDLNRPLPAEQAAAVEGCSRRRAQQALVFFSDDLAGQIRL